MARTMTIYNKYILNTIVSLKRNIKGYKYPDMLMWSKLNEILNMVLEALKNTSYSFMLYEVSNMDKEKFEYFLAKGFMDESVKENITRTKLLLDEDKSIAIVINNNDHIEIRVLGTASADELVDIAIDIERELDKSIDFQFDEDYGYLTSDPVNIGNGINIAKILIYLSNLMFARSMDLLDPAEASIDASLYLMITPEAIEYTYSISDKSEIDQKRATILREKLGKIKFIDKDINEEENKDL